MADSLLERYKRQATIIDDLARREQAGWKPAIARLLAERELQAAGGQYYWDSRPPFNRAAYPSVTLATTSKMLVPTNPNTAIQPSEWFVGKKFYIRTFGQSTTAVTPGNLTVEIRLTTTDAGAPLLASSAATPLTASKTNICWLFEATIECWDTGSGSTSGSLLAHGTFTPDNAGLLIPAASNPLLIPASGLAAVTADLSAASGISVQMKRSGSTVETAQVFSQVIAAVN